MAESIQTKRCSKCKQFKIPTKFCKDRSTKDGLQSQCKMCHKVYNEDSKISNFCLTCGNEFKHSIYYPQKYCSKKCAGKRTKSKEYRIKLGNAQRGKTGAKAAHWKGGRRKHKGYILIYCPEHPFAMMRFYVKEHRLVMEKHLGRFLRPEEIVHHINRDKTDNHIENLKLFKNHSEHMTFLNHRRALM